jgi:hypothetical protein
VNFQEESYHAEAASAATISHERERFLQRELRAPTLRLKVLSDVDAPLLHIA